MKKQMFTTALAAITVTSALAVPAKPGRQTITQSDGTVITVERVGDERFHAYVTTDGLTVEPGVNGDFFYTTAEGITAVRAHNPGQRTSQEASFLRTEAAELTMPKLASKRISNATRLKSAPLKAQKPQVPNIGEAKVPVLLLSFRDKDFIDGENAASAFEDFLNGNGVSVGQYFRDQSNGLYNPHFDIYGPYQLTGNTSVYGGNDRYGNDRGLGKMVAEGCTALNAQIDFSQYDNDGDGVCDVVIVLYAGPGEASVDYTYPNAKDLVWPAQWELSASDYGKSLFQDGVTIDKFAVFNEAHGSDTGKIDGIGTMCHEFSHCLGLPDFYDTNYNYYGMGNWSLMCSGSYNDDGYTPIGYSAYEKAFMKWIDIPEARPNTRYTLPAMNQKSAETDLAVKATSDRNSDEYFIFENRRQQGWDRFIPAEGMLITHVDFLQTSWDNNVVNNYATQRMSPVPADNAANSSSESGDLWPGRNDSATQFTDTSRPAATVHTGGTLGKPVTDIKRNDDGTISFHFMPGVLTPLSTPLLSSASDITDSKFTASWTHDEAEHAGSYTLEVRKHTDVEQLLSTTFVDSEADWTVVSGTSAMYNVNTEDFVLGSNRNIGTIVSPAVNPKSINQITVLVEVASYGSDNSSLCAWSSDNDTETTAPSSAKIISITDSFAYYAIVLDAEPDTDNHIYLGTTGNKKRVRIHSATIYSGDASALFSGDDVIINKAPSSSIDDNGVITITGITALSHIVEGLIPGEKYDFRVKALPADPDNYTESEWTPRETVTLTLAGIHDVTIDSVTETAVEYFTIQGTKVNAGNLTPGIYVERRGTTVRKIVIR